MKDYYKPDSRWKIYRITSKEEFVKQYVIKGKFHKDVPKDIVDAYTTVEYLLAHSYYWWPMFDEAFLKVLMLLETAVKLRAKSLDIDLKKVNKRKKEANKKLCDLIDEVCMNLDSDVLKTQLHRARKIRNPSIHKDSNSYMGAMGGLKDNLYLFVNLINYLFLTKEQIITSESQQDKIKEFLIKLAQPLAILELEQSRILIKGFSIVNYFKFNTELLLISCIPVINDLYETLNNGSLPDPILVVSKSFQLGDGSISGRTLEGQKFMIIQTLDQRNLDKLKLDQDDYKKLDHILKSHYDYNNRVQHGWEIQRIIYEQVWEGN